MVSKHALSLVFPAILLLTASAFAESLIPPPIPDVRPIIGASYSSDQDGDRIDDELQVRLGAEKTTDLAIAAVDLEELVDVELIFKDQITPQQIDAFLELGGRIDYIYQAVSYGWNGQIPLSLVEALPAVMGDSLVHVQGSRKIVLYMDKATETGRVRPIWQPGFAGSVTGYDGDPNIVIGIIDTGVDANHPDLAGRCVYWEDFSNEDLPNPVDYGQHGTLVAGVALGSGQAGGSGRGVLTYTTSIIDDTNDPPALYPAPITLPQDGDAYSFVASATRTGPGGLLSLLEWPEGQSASEALDGPGLGILASAETGEIAIDLVGKDGFLYMPYLLPAADANLVDPVIVSSVSSYPGATDGFNTFRGVAPACRWAGAKVVTRAGEADALWVGKAIDDFVTKRKDLNIKIINLSLGLASGSSGTNLPSKISTAVSNGILVVVAGGNDGEGPAANASIGEVGLSAEALTVVATNDRNALTAYSSRGLSSKPDLAAPGGSAYYTGILGPDSGSSDGNGVPDCEPNDYQCVMGTSFASPFVAGSAALVIDALEQKGMSSDFSVARYLPKFVKMVLCATATESGMDRENGQFSPYLQRGARGLDGFPDAKDPYEGYGIINPDAAIEAATLQHPWGPVKETLGEGSTERRAWARREYIVNSRMPHEFTLACPPTGDFDLYLYKGSYKLDSPTPEILDSSTKVGKGKSESISYSYNSPEYPGDTILVVKRASGYGEFTLTGICPLRAGVYRTISGVPQRFSVRTPGDSSNSVYRLSHRWIVAGIQSATNHDVRLFSSKDANTPAMTSEDAVATASDFVVVNGHKTIAAAKVFYVDVSGDSPDPYQVETAEANDDLLTGGQFGDRILEGEVLDMFRANVVSGKKYNLALDIRNGDADLGLYVFAPSRDYGSRTDNDGAANDAGPGKDESLSFTATASGYYGIVVVNENGGSCEYAIECWEE